MRGRQVKAADVHFLSVRRALFCIGDRANTCLASNQSNSWMPLERSHV